MYRYIYSKQAVFAGTRYDKQAAKILVDSGLFDEQQANEIIDALFHNDIHAFVHAPNWLEKYLKGIARICIEEGNGSAQGVANFLERSPAVFDRFLTYVKENRDKLGGAAFDTKFNTQMHYQDVVDFLDDIQDELDKQSAEELSSMQFGASNYELVPIDSYNQFHKLFGGHWSGDGSSDAYAGGGGTAWCHANSDNVYDHWIQDGKCCFYVLADKNFKNIPFDAQSNDKNPKDRYGNSLIAILVDTNNGRLLNATLRCNHVGVHGNADNQYKTYAELSKVVGFNVEEAVREDLSLGRLSDITDPTFEVGDKLIVPIGGIGEIPTTCVQVNGDEYMFVTDIDLATLHMFEVDNYLRSLIFPPEFEDRIQDVRLLQASEVFSDCDSKECWEYMTSVGAKMENPQIDYFIPVENRRIQDSYCNWWLSTSLVALSEAMDNTPYYASVFYDGSSYAKPDRFTGSVRPVIIIK